MEDLLGAASRLLGAMSDLALVVDRDGRILYSNRQGERMTGTTVFEHDLGAEAEARMRAALHQVFGARQPISYEVETEPVRSLTRWSPIERE